MVPQGNHVWQEIIKMLKRQRSSILLAELWIINHKH